MKSNVTSNDTIVNNKSENTSSSRRHIVAFNGLESLVSTAPGSVHATWAPPMILHPNGSNHTEVTGIVFSLRFAAGNESSTEQSLKNNVKRRDIPETLSSEILDPDFKGGRYFLFTMTAWVNGTDEIIEAPSLFGCRIASMEPALKLAVSNFSGEFPVPFTYDGNMTISMQRLSPTFDDTLKSKIGSTFFMESDAVYYIAIGKVLIEDIVYTITVTPLTLTDIFRTLQVESSHSIQNPFQTVPVDSRRTEMTTNLGPMVLEKGPFKLSSEVNILSDISVRRQHLTINEGSLLSFSLELSIQWQSTIVMTMQLEAMTEVLTKAFPLGRKVFRILVYGVPVRFSLSLSITTGVELTALMKMQLTIPRIDHKIMTVSYTAGHGWSYKDRNVEVSEASGSSAESLRIEQEGTLKATPFVAINLLAVFPIVILDLEVKAFAGVQLTVIVRVCIRARAHAGDCVCVRVREEKKKKKRERKKSYSCIHFVCHQILHSLFFSLQVRKQNFFFNSNPVVLLADTVSLTYGLDITTNVRLPDARELHELYFANTHSKVQHDVARFLFPVFARWRPPNWTWVKPRVFAPLTLPVITVNIRDFGCLPDVGRYLELSYTVTEGLRNGLINDTRPSVQWFLTSSHTGQKHSLNEYNSTDEYCLQYCRLNNEYCRFCTKNNIIIPTAGLPADATALVFGTPRFPGAGFRVVGSYRISDAPVPQCCVDTECGLLQQCDTGTCVRRGNPRFSLYWEGDADLDLHVLTPSNYEIFFSRPVSSDGGRLDVDRIPTVWSRWIENIFWPPDGSAPSGKYTYWVNNYRGNKTPWTLRVYQVNTVVEEKMGYVEEKQDSIHFEYHNA